MQKTVGIRELKNDTSRVIRSVYEEMALDREQRERAAKDTKSLARLPSPHPHGPHCRAGRSVAPVLPCRTGAAAGRLLLAGIVDSRLHQPEGKWRLDVELG